MQVMGALNAHSIEAVSSYTPTFFFLHPYIFLPAPHNVMQRLNCPYYFLKSENPLELYLFFCILDYGIHKIFGLKLPVKFWIHHSVIQNMHFTFKNPSFRKAFWIHQSKIFILYSEIHN